MSVHPLVESWLISNRINLYFLESVPDSAWDSKPEKGKAVSAQFAHMHNVRLMWLKAIDPATLTGLAKLEGKEGRAATAAALNASAEALAALVQSALEQGQRMKGFKPSTEAFVCYLIAHEAHHRGQAELALRQAGVPLDDKISYGLWEWGSR